MGLNMGVVANQIILFAIMMGIGFAAGKFRVISKEGLGTLAGILVNILLPSMFFSTAAGGNMKIEEFSTAGIIAVGFAINYALLILTGHFFGRLMGLRGKQANVFIMLNTFGNSGFMGMPLILSIFTGTVARVCMSVNSIFDTVLLWTLGVYLAGRHQGDYNRKTALKNIVNPNTVALALAFLVLIFKIKLPDILMNTISGLGNTSQFFSMLFIGASLSYVSAKSLIKNRSIYALPLLKMIALPVLVYIVTGLFLPQIPRTVLTLVVALPCMNTVAVVAKTYGSDDEYATQAIFVTTIFSLATIPLVSLIISFL